LSNLDARIALRLDPDLRKLLAAVAASEGRSMGDVVRRLVREGLDARLSDLDVTHANGRPEDRPSEVIVSSREDSRGGT